MQSRIDSNIRELISLILSEDAKSLVGDYLWPDGRVKGELVSLEPDTPREAELRQKIVKYVADNGKKTLGQNDIDDLMIIASDLSYKDTLPLLKRGIVYRGISVSSSWFERNFGMTYDDVLSQDTEKSAGAGEKLFYVIQTLEKRGIINPASPITSWSKNIDVAVKFAGGSPTGSDYSVPLVLQAEAAENDFIDLKSVYFLDPYDSSLYHNKREKEVLSVGPVKISRVHVIAWKGRSFEELMPNTYKKIGSGYDDLGSPVPGFEDRLRSISRKELDKRFDAKNFPDLG